MALHLVGVDGGERGDDALTLAVRLAALYDARLLAVHVVRLPPLRQRLGGEVIETLEAQAEEVLARARERMAGLASSGARATFARSPADGLQRACHEEGAGLVTVGSTRRGRIGRLLAGTTGLALLSGAPCPVALAPLGYAATAGAITSVVTGYDGGDEARVALAVAADVARRAGVGLRIVTAVEPLTAVMAPASVELAPVLEQEAREYARRALEDGLARVPEGVAAEGELAEGDPGRVLARAVRGTSDLLVLGSRRYGPRLGVVAGSVVHHLVREGSCPVLAVPRGVELDRAGELLAAPASAA